MAKKSGTDLIVDNTANVVYIQKASALIKMYDNPKKRPSGPVKKDNSSMEYEPWGDDNDYPGTILEPAEKNSIIPSTLAWKANQISSGGFVYGYIDGYKDGRENFVPLEIPEIEDFLAANAIDLYLEEGLRDLYWWNNTYADIYKNAKDKIAALLIQEAPDCRFGKQNKKTGKKEFIYLDGNWPNATEETWTRIPCLDPYYNVQEQLQAKIDRFIYPLSFSSPKQKYYQKASWHSLIESGWLKVAEKIVLLKLALMDNQMHIKYIIHVPEWWWKWKYPTWDRKTEAEKLALQKAELEAFNKVLTGVKNVGKTLMLTFKMDAYGKQYTKWEIIPLHDKLQTGLYIEDSKEVVSHILFSLLVDGTLIGNSPGKEMGAGSGSDKLRANNIFIINNKPYLDKMAKPLDIITRYNEWKGPEGKKIVWRGRSYLLATLDSGKTTEEQN